MSQQPFSSDGGFVTAGNITVSESASPAPSINGFFSVNSNNISLGSGRINGGDATVVTDGINSIAQAPGAQMDVFGFPFASGLARGQLTITDVTTPSEANGTWYYQSVNSYTYQIYTDSTYTTLVDASGWSAYTGGGSVAFTLQSPPANIVINTNGFLTTFANTGSLILPGSLNSAANLTITANTQSWTFGTNGVATLPGEGILQSIDDTVTLQSFNTSTGNANSVYLGTSGGLGFNDGEIGGNWLEIFRNGTEPEIRVPVGLGNLNIQTASGNTAYNWVFDDTGNLSAPGNISTTGNVTAANFIGNISLTGNVTGTSANVQLVSGSYTWTFDNTGNLTIPASGDILLANTQSTISAAGNITGGNLLTGGQITSTGAGNTATNGGQIFLNGATLNRIDWNTNGTGAPEYTTRSAGAKIVLYPAIGGSATDYALGVEAGALWSGIPGNDGGQFFKWYGGNVPVASLSGTGVFSASGNVTASSLNGNANISNVTINSYTFVPQLWFKGTLSADQSLTTGDDTVILYDTNSDPSSWGTTASSNGRIVPTKAGWYEVVSRAQFSAIAGNVNAQINHQILVSGVQQAISQEPNSAVVGAGVSVMATAMVELNGTTDYITTSCYTTIAGQTCVGSTSTMLLVKWVST